MLNVKKFIFLTSYKLRELRVCQIRF